MLSLLIECTCPDFWVLESTLRKFARVEFLVRVYILPRSIFTSIKDWDFDPDLVNQPSEVDEDDVCHDVTVELGTSPSWFALDAKLDRGAQRQAEIQNITSFQFASDCN